VKPATTIVDDFHPKGAAMAQSTGETRRESGVDAPSKASTRADGKTITKKDLVEAITLKTKLPKQDVRNVCHELLDAVIVELRRGNRLELRDFGVFETKVRAARRGQNPRTLEKVDVPSRRTVKFKPGRLMRMSIEPRQGRSAGLSAAKVKAPVAIQPGDAEPDIAVFTRSAAEKAKAL
jgi:DNA-binding protein HU-beta/integration host factor subunit beta